MSPQLSQDVEQMVATNADGVIRMNGANGATYWLLSQEAMEVHQQVLEGLSEADRGQSEAWDAAEIKKLGRKRMQERPHK